MKKMFLLSMLFVASLTIANAQTTNYQVYALYVVNIAKYSSWPALNGEINIGVVGKSKAFEELQKLNGKVVNGATIKVKQFDTEEGLGESHILYVSDGKSSSIDDIVKSTEGKPVCIVAEREGLFKKGASFSFVIMENKTLRFDINLSDLEKRSIKVSKNLSNLANSSI